MENTVPPLPGSTRKPRRKKELHSIDKRYFRSRWKSFLKQDDDGQLYVHGVSMQELERKFGTPLYIFSEEEIRSRFQRMLNVFSSYPKIRLQYPCKINSNLEVLRMAREEGCDLDASSIGEIILGLLADFEPKDISFTNLHKTEQDIFFAAQLGVRYITVDYIEEIKKIHEVGRKLNKQIDIMIRINPLLEWRGYSTCMHKYGIPLDEAKEAIDIATRRSYINLCGFHFHGGYINSPKPYYEAARVLCELAGYSRQKGNRVEIIDLGGGFPRETMAKKVFQPEQMGDRFVNHFQELLQEFGLADDPPELVFEPGKFILSAAGMGLMKVISRKYLPKDQHLVVTDGSTYGFVPDVLFDKKLQLDVLPAERMNAPRIYDYAIAGNTCDHWDIIANKRKLPKLEEEDLLMIMDIGAYSHVLASNFNNMKRAPIVLIDESGRIKLIRRRDRYSEMFAPELDVLKIADPYELQRYYHLARKNLNKVWNGSEKMEDEHDRAGIGF